MAVYDKNGNVLSAVYGKNGNALSIAYGKNGDTIYTSDSGDYSDIVSYYQSQAVSAKRLASEAVANGKVVFGIVTDTHGAYNSNNSQAIVNYLLKNGVPWFIHLGDFSATNWIDAEVNSWLNPMSDVIDKFYIAIGNHEYYGDASHSSHTDLTLLTNTLINKTVSGSVQDGYYYFDDSDLKVRFIVINSGGGGNYGNAALSSTQLSWLQASINALSSDWSYVILSHSNLDQTYGTTSYQQYTSKSGNTIIGYCSQSLAKCIGTFSGHLHVDRSAQVGNTGIWHTTLLNDSCRQGSGHGVYTPPTRTAGTDSEQAINIVIIDTVTGDTDIHRIGAGSDISYNYIELTGGVDYDYEAD